MSGSAKELILLAFAANAGAAALNIHCALKCDSLGSISRTVSFLFGAVSAILAIALLWSFVSMLGGPGAVYPGNILEA